MICPWLQQTVRHNKEAQSLDMSAEPSIPLIDFHQFVNGSIDKREQVASTIDAAFRSVGFIYLENHGIDDDKVDECFRWVSLYSFLCQV